MLFQKGISLKVNVIARLEYGLVMLFGLKEYQLLGVI